MTRETRIPAPDRKGRLAAGTRWREWRENAHPDGVWYEHYVAGRVTYRVWYDGRTDARPDGVSREDWR